MCVCMCVCVYFFSSPIPPSLPLHSSAHLAPPPLLPLPKVADIQEQNKRLKDELTALRDENTRLRTDNNTTHTSPSPVTTTTTNASARPDWDMQCHVTTTEASDPAVINFPQQVPLPSQYRCISFISPSHVFKCTYTRSHKRFSPCSRRLR
jgi:hypothetical protein